MSYEVFPCQVVCQGRKPFFNLLLQNHHIFCRTHPFHRFSPDLQQISRFPCRTHRFHCFWPPSAMSYEVFLCQVVSQARKPFFNLLQHIPRFPCRTHRFHPIPTDSTISLPNAPFSPFLASVSRVL